MRLSFAHIDALHGGDEDESRSRECLDWDGIDYLKLDRAFNVAGRRRGIDAHTHARGKRRQLSAGMLCVSRQTDRMRRGTRVILVNRDMTHRRLSRERASR
jgi:hypothetical protein